MEAQVLADDPVPALCERAVEPLRGGEVGVGGDVVVAAEAGGRGQQDHDLVGVAHLDPVAEVAQRAADRQHPRPGAEAQPALDAVRRFVAPLQQQAAVPVGDRARRGLVALQAHAQADAAGHVAGQPHRQALGRRRHQRLAPVLHAACLEGRGRDGRIEIELAPVAAGLGDLEEVQHQVAERLVGHLLERPRHQPFVRQRLGLGVAAGEQQAAHPRQCLAHALGRRVVRAAGVQGVVVELDPLIPGATPDHGAQRAVAQRQRLDPLGGGARVPEAEMVPRTRLRGGVDGARIRCGGPRIAAGAWRPRDEAKPAGDGGEGRGLERVAAARVEAHGEWSGPDAVGACPRPLLPPPRPSPARGGGSAVYAHVATASAPRAINSLPRMRGKAGVGVARRAPRVMPPAAPRPPRCRRTPP
ncbi:hypothetical protein L599_000400000860 [Luteimonas sp. J16]|nr:hypothetical protein L599_000400000860 [Luteimonas sp. J16]